MQPAAEEPGTRAALEAHQAGALRWLGGGAIALVLGILLGAAVVTLTGTSGQRYPGVGLLVLVMVLGGVTGLVVGIGGLVRSLRWRRALSSTTWRTGRLRIAGPAVVAFEPEGYDELDPDAEPVRLRLLSTAVWRTRAVQSLDGGEVRAAPVGRGQWVLTADDAGTLFGARAAGRGG